MKFTAFALFLFLSIGLKADMLQLKDGSVLTGTFAGGTIASIRFEVGSEIKTFPVSQVAAITFGGSEQSQSVGGNSTVAATSAAPAAPAAAATIPAGTPLLVSLGQELDSGSSKQGQTFSGSLVSALTVDGVVVAPAGSQVTGTINEVHGARRLMGRHASLSFSLTGLTINGKQYRISTSPQSEDIKGKGMVRDAAGGAAKGAIFGAIANDDAGDGALAGMAASAAGGVLRKPEQVVYKQGTILAFDLTQSVSL